MDETRQIQVVTEGTTEYIDCSMISQDVYRCEESSLFNESLVYGTDIEVTNNVGVLEFARIVNESPFLTERLLLSKEVLNSDKGEKAKEKIIEYGGNWEQIWGGFFLFHLPKDKKEKIVEIKDILKGES